MSRAFWDSTGSWRLSHFDRLRTADPRSLSPHLRAEREFVIVEDLLVGELIAEAGLVVDLGCGTGRSLLPGARRFAEKKFVGLDYSVAQLEIFQHLICSEGHRQAFCAAADVGKVPLATGRFDLALMCNNTFGTLLGETRRNVLTEVARILQRDGRLCIGGFTNLSMAPGYYEEARGRRIVRIDHTRRLVVLESYKSLWQEERVIRRLLSNSGFRVVATRSTVLGFVDVFEKV